VPRTPQARHLRTTGTGTVRNLTAVGTTSTVTTIARFATAGIVSTIRWSPAVAATAAAAVPAAPSTAVAGVGWRDLVAGSVEPITYAAGTWTLQFRVSKSAQTIENAIIIRITAIVYEVTSAGAWVTEIGRMGDNVVAAVVAGNVSASFTTGAPTPIGAGNKIQVEIVVQPVIGDLPTPPASGVDISLHCDGPAAETTSFTAVPQFTTQFARATPDTAGASGAVTRGVIQTRALADTAPAADVLTRKATFPRATADTAPAADSLTRIARRPRAISDAAPAADAVKRQTVQARSTTDTALAADALARILIQVRATADTAPAADTLTRVAFRPRATADTAPAADALTRTALRFRSTADTAPAADSLTRILIQVRNLTDNIGPTGAGGGGEAPVTPADIAAIANAVWDEMTAESRLAGSYGATVAARLDAAVSSRSTPADVTAARDVVTTAVGTPAQVAAVTALGSPAQAGALATLSTSVGTPAQVAALAAVHAAVTALGSPSQASAYTPARAALLDALARLDVTVSTRATPADLQVSVSPGPTGTVS